VGVRSPIPRHRDDLQGLRGLAILLVVLGHAGVPFLQGGFVGVDVFFVLSGFLITGLLLSQVATHGRVSLSEFYVRRARRILPAAALTLVVTDVVAFRLLNFVRAKAVVTDSLWASIFGANFHFASERSDYFARTRPPSPLQNYWTLSVEEQFYLVWPVVLALLVAGAIFLGRRRTAPPPVTRSVVSYSIVAIAAAGLASLAWSIYSTQTSPVVAYFSTFSRVWELALGAGLALAATRVTRVPQCLRAASSWAGLGCIVAAAILFSGRTPFPGYAALLPAIGAALVIAAGSRFLSIAPLRYLGDRSYALYLWHWPVLVIALDYSGHQLSTGAKLLLVGVAFLLSIVSYGLFENPIRRMKWRGARGLVLWPAAAVAVLAVSVPILSTIQQKALRIEEASAAVRPGTLVDPALRAPQAPATLPPVRAAVRAARRGAPLPSPLTPPVGQLEHDRYNFPPGCAADPGQTSSQICRLGASGPAKTLVVMGDSHARMWMPPILRMAQQDGWVVVPFVKPRCVPRTWFQAANECSVWYRWATSHAAALHPYVTLIVGSWAGTAAPGAAVKPVAALGLTMRRSSATVIVVGDAPTQTRDPVDCLLSSGATMKTCTVTATGAQLRADDSIAAGARKNRVGFMRTRGWFCARGGGAILCPLVINQTIVWADRGHISQTYALELAGPFRAAFRHALFGS
jgi:peptidoglycan/LPS O-acetylase OafA/YrhL